MRKLYEEVIKRAGYGITVPEYREQRFIQKRLVEVAYRMGVDAGMSDRKKIDKLIADFNED